MSAPRQSLAQGAIALGISRLGIGGENDRFSVVLDAETQAPLGMVQAGGLDAKIVQLERLGGDFRVATLRAHGGHIHGEVGLGHLPPKVSSKAAS